MLLLISIWRLIYKYKDKICKCFSCVDYIILSRKSILSKNVNEEIFGIFKAGIIN